MAVRHLVADQSKPTEWKSLCGTWPANTPTTDTQAVTCAKCIDRMATQNSRVQLAVAGMHAALRTGHWTTRGTK